MLSISFVGVVRHIAYIICGRSVPFRGYGLVCHWLVSVISFVFISVNISVDSGKSRGMMSSCKILRQIKNMRTCLGENSIEHLIMTFSCPLVFYCLQLYNVYP